MQKLADFCWFSAPPRIETFIACSEADFENRAYAQENCAKLARTAFPTGPRKFVRLPLNPKILHCQHIAGRGWGGDPNLLSSEPLPLEKEFEASRPAAIRRPVPSDTLDLLACALYLCLIYGFVAKLGLVAGRCHHLSLCAKPFWPKYPAEKKTIALMRLNDPSMQRSEIDAKPTLNDAQKAQGSVHVRKHWKRASCRIVWTHSQRAWKFPFFTPFLPAFLVWIFPIQTPTKPWKLRLEKFTKIHTKVHNTLGREKRRIISLFLTFLEFCSSSPRVLSFYATCKRGRNREFRVKRCFPHLPVVHKFLRFDSGRLIEGAWK